MSDERAPPLLRLLREGPAVAALFLAPLRRPPEMPKVGKGRPVLVLPGFLANDGATSLLRRTLEASGYRAFGWEMGFNRGATPDILQRLGARLDAVKAETGAPAALVGWSLGGLYARELARGRAHDVDLVITLGTPFSGDLRANNAWRVYEWVSGHKVDKPPVPLDPAKPPVRTIALWSARDGIVAPASARGTAAESDERIELSCTHMGFVTEAEPLRRIVDLLRP